MFLCGEAGGVGVQCDCSGSCGGIKPTSEVSGTLDTSNIISHRDIGFH